MRFFLLLLLLSFSTIELSAQETKSEKLYEKSLKFYKHKEYKMSDSILRLALTYNSSQKNYTQLAKVKKAMGDTCEYCNNLKLAKSFGYNEDLIKEYSINCIDTIWHNDTINKYKLFCTKPKYSCLKEEFQSFYIKTEETLKYRFSIINSDYEYVSDTLNNFPDIEKNLNNLLFFMTDENPEFSSNGENLNSFLAKNIRYPVSARDNNITGKVHLTFIVDEIGNIKNIKISKGVYEALDNEAIRVVKLMPKWKPGKYKGKPVKVILALPISFDIKN